MLNLSKVIISFLIIIISFPLYSSEESESYPEFYQLEFQKNEIGFSFENGNRPRVPSDKLVMVYATLVDKHIKILTEKEFKTKFANMKIVSELPVNYYEAHKIFDQNRTEYKVKYSACTVTNETDDVCNKLTIQVDKKLIDINLKASKICEGCRVIALERWKDSLWMSFAFRSEYEPYGHGVHILELKSKKIISPIKVGSPLVTIIRKDPVKEIMWLGGNNGLYGYNAEFNLVHSCKITYPFWDKNNKNLKLKHNDFKFNCEK